MLKRLIKMRIAAFERRYGYDMSYGRDLLDADLAAFMAFGKVMPLSRYRRDLPLDAWYASKVAAAMVEDCGPCTQLVVRMAEEAGVDASTLRAVVAGDDEALSEPVALCVRFVRAVMRREDTEDVARDAIVARWGPRALASIACAITSARIFPTMKRALGHGRSCSRVVIGGESVAPGVSSSLRLPVPDNEVRA